MPKHTFQVVKLSEKNIKMKKFKKKIQKKIS